MRINLENMQIQTNTKKIYTHIHKPLVIHIHLLILTVILPAIPSLTLVKISNKNKHTHPLEQTNYNGNKRTVKSNLIFLHFFVLFVCCFYFRVKH